MNNYINFVLLKIKQTNRDRKKVTTKILMNMENNIQQYAMPTYNYDLHSPEEYFELQKHKHKFQL